jgi:hypothetical protein
MPEPNIFPRHIRTPRPAPEAIRPDRHELWIWLAQKLLDSRHFRVEQPVSSVYVTSEQMKTDPGVIWNLLEPPPSTGNRPSLAIIDLSANPYHSLREIFLHHVSEISVSWLRGSPSRKVAILLPLLPPQSSLFWTPMVSDGMDMVGESRLIALGNDGACRPAEIGRDSFQDYSRHQPSAGQDLKKMLEARIIRKLGHYRLGSEEDPHCAEYYFETDAAEREIGELVIQWVEEHIQSRESSRAFTLVSHGNLAERFHAAVAGAAVATNCRFFAIAEGGSLPTEDVEGEVALVFNIVHTGRTFRAVVENLRAQGMHLAPESLAVMCTDPQLDLGGSLPALRALCRRDRQKIPRASCPQCRLMLPPNDPKSEGQIGIRAFDMWHMLSRCQWHQEGFGPRGRKLLGYVPDMGDVFDTYGDYIAFKVAEVLRGLGLHQDVVLVCPEEPHIERLVARLGIIMQNRQVAVHIPRRVLNSTNLDRALRGTEEMAWHRQLRHLARRGYDNVIIIDEFTISYTTASAIVRLLQRSEFRIEPRAYVPIIDFSSAGGMAAPPTYPLYRMPNPWVGQ